MEERNEFSKQDWYSPLAPQVESEEECIDVFEEAGIYQMRSRDELYAQNRPKRGKGIWLILLLIAVLVGAIALTSKLFADDGNDNDGSFYSDYGDYYKQYANSEITGENDIPRAEVAPGVTLILKGHDGLQPLTKQELYAKCIPSVVGVRTSVRGSVYGWGTGIVMTADGYILTNTHVLDNADSVEVLLYDGRILEGKLVGADAISDVAVLKIEATGLTPAQFGDSALVQVGDDAIAIGNPLSESYSGTMSVGIVSGLARNVNHNGRTMTLLQTDAALNGGNSGGPLFNCYGQVIGITNMKMMTSSLSVVEGIGFAIPTATVKEMAEAILDDGAVVGRPGLGIMVYDLDGGTEEYPDGMLVDSVTAGSDAEKQGLQPNDIIIEIDGQAAESIEVLRDAINRKRVGDTVTVKIWREGEILELEIKLMDQNDY